MQADPSRTTFHGLDALRGIAALLVVLFHCDLLLGVQIAPSGYLAVDLFFALSGFVIAHSYDRRLATTMSTRTFVIVRLIRFWPLYALGLAGGALFEGLLLATGNDFAMPAATLAACVLVGLLLVPAMFHTRFDQLFPLNGVSWSLFFEVIVNIAYALVHRWLNLRILAVIAAVSGVALTFFNFQYGSFAFGFLNTEIPHGLARSIFSFTVGVLLYRSGWYHAVKLPIELTMLILAILLVMPVSPAVRPFYDLAFAVIATPLIVMAGTVQAASPVALRVGALLGEASYAVYAVHKPLLSFTITFVKRTSAPREIVTIAFVVGVVMLAVLLNRWFDKPVRAWLSSKLDVRRAPAALEVSAP